jgi:hypothetical protein
MSGGSGVKGGVPKIGGVDLSGLILFGLGFAGRMEMFMREPA